jgi:hypothetical protein
MIKAHYLATAMMVFPLAFGGLASTQTMAQQITGTLGSPGATIRRRDQGDSRRIEELVAATASAAQGRT